MKFNKTANGGAPDATIELTPLIDVVFQLLIFFMVTMSFVKSGEHMLPVDLAEVTHGGQGENEVFDGMTISVAKDGKVAIDGRRDTVGDDVLAERLRLLHDRNEYAQILLRGDESVSHGRVLIVLDLVKAAGFENVDMVVTRFEAE